VADPLFGLFEIPERFQRILQAPEVQRLREVRLINTSTPSLAALSDVRRFTHTQGVVHLALRVAEQLKWKWSPKEIDTLIVAAIVHDVASPAFAHLFEYLLNSKYGFTHEAMLGSVIGGQYKRTNRFHQVYYGGQLQLPDTIAELAVDYEEVLLNVTGKAPLSALLAGTIDLDNLDNVYRMATSLGFEVDVQSVYSLIRQFDVNPETCRLTISEEGLPHIENWRRLRRKSYEIIAFDEQALASQAMLTDCLAEAVANDLLKEEDWFLTDEQMLRTLINFNDKVSVSLREAILRFATADYYSTVFLGWYLQPRGDYDLRLPQIRAKLRDDLRDALGYPVTPYIFYDRGTFEKKVTVHIGKNPKETSETVIGETSTSTIVSVFSENRVSKLSRRSIDRVCGVLEDFGLVRDSLRPIPDKQDVYGRSGRTELAF
jgi:hypothetical protein